MSKDQGTEGATDAAGDGPHVGKAQPTRDELDARCDTVVDQWRSAWSDLSRTEDVLAQGPSFVVWDSQAHGSESPGDFFPVEAIDQVMPPDDIQQMLRKCLDTLDHAREMAAVLVLRDESGVVPTVTVVPKMAELKPQSWFEMRKIRKTSIDRTVWIPLRAHQRVCSEGEYGHEGFLDEYLGVGSVMFELSHREQISKLDYGDIGDNDYTGGVVTEYFWTPLAPSTEAGAADQSQEDSEVGQAGQEESLASFRVPFTNLSLALNLRTQKPKAATPVAPASTPEPEAPSVQQSRTTFYWAGDWSSHHGGAVGTGLVIQQSFEREAPDEWHLHQDFVISMGLLREGDKWLRPDEGFEEVARLLRNDAGEPVRLDVRLEHLRDYLKAREMYLLVSSYRSRQQVVASPSHISWSSDLLEEVTVRDKWEGVRQAIHEGGNPYGSATAVFHASRTDIDGDDEVPVLGFPNDDSVVSKSWTVKHQGKKLYIIRGSLWKNDVVEPGRVSERVLSEAPVGTVDFAIDGSGERIGGSRLADSGSWLWFRPSITTTLSKYRNFSLSWATRDTGFIGLTRNHSVHFGLNDLGLINVLGKDIGRLPLWQQRVWAGANVAPNGGVSRELLASQANADPADTHAPEARLQRAYTTLNKVFAKLTGKPLFTPHPAIEDIFSRIYRFRALEETGLLELAKDLARVTVESLDGSALSVLADPPPKMKAGSVKHLEAALQKEVSQDDARAITKVLVGINELRQADAHLPSSGFGKAYGLVGIDDLSELDVVKGRLMLESLVDSLVKMVQVFFRFPH
ncbi:hypothetical protein GCM10011247_12490 [Pseudomonas plecoglossicida]|uniref:Uncharacterized protein n=2 Tax=Pseudomonas plecoglossicida TaxID=70775 RepID=A0AAD0VTB3_PSEDL|nr:hypothetical protein DVB73_08100 [Pseudomonas plecoglossicida]EPB95966.1 hypothetical protein L321_10705 [Pseudomonas plecoglossicida NB2011]GLR35852.1 hypothetical protein GCM10011247_12490 [Pseudomonas plecoglossicida]